MLLATARTDIADYLSTVIYVYTLLIVLFVVVQLLFSVGLRPPYSRTLDALLSFLREICEPYLRLFRRIVPVFGGFDFRRHGPRPAQPAGALPARDRAPCYWLGWSPSGSSPPISSPSALSKARLRRGMNIGCSQASISSIRATAAWPSAFCRAAMSA
jgi:uncharacterized protein YggT (Ycf19 family)